MMDTDRQIFRYNRVAAGAFLSSASGLNFEGGPTSLYRFVGREPHELTPGHISDAPVNRFVAVRFHLLNVELLKDNQPVPVDKLAGLLMGEIGSPVLDPGVGVVKGLESF